MSLIFEEGQNFYPCHPSPEKTHQIQSTPSPMLEGQTAPFEAAELRRAFDQDPEGSLAIYQDKRFDMTGIVIWAGLDPHNLPTIQKNWQRIKNESKVFACARRNTNEYGEHR